MIGVDILMLNLPVSQPVSTNQFWIPASLASGIVLVSYRNSAQHGSLAGYLRCHAPATMTLDSSRRASAGRLLLFEVQNDNRKRQRLYAFSFVLSYLHIWYVQFTTWQDTLTFLRPYDGSWLRQRSLSARMARLLGEQKLCRVLPDHLVYLLSRNTQFVQALNVRSHRFIR